VTTRDYYEILGIEKGADAAGIKKAYRALAMKFHPDRNQDDPQALESMKEVNEAYAVLSDPGKRRLYDTYGHEGLKGYSQLTIRKWRRNGERKHGNYPLLMIMFMWEAKTR
jgi:DnaJ-class molecular chaperone